MEQDDLCHTSHGEYTVALDHMYIELNDALRETARLMDLSIEDKVTLLKQATWYPVATQAYDENIVACLLGPMEAMLVMT